MEEGIKNSPLLGLLCSLFSCTLTVAMSHFCRSHPWDRKICSWPCQSALALVFIS